MQQQKLIAILGPTASGKTSLAVELALRLNGEIISGDSMLVFKKLDIGTAKPTAAERCGIKHHLIDICEPHDIFNVAQFQELAKNIIIQINLRGKVPILCGGTGLYAKALLENYDFSTESGANPVIRQRLNNILTEQGIAPLREELLMMHNNAADYIDISNPRRIIRAIETLLANGKLPSTSRQGLAYNAVVLAIEYPRAQLYQRINARVDNMLRNGLFEEVNELLESGLDPRTQSLQGIGYKEIVDYRLNNLLDKVATIERIKIATRHFAKRQLTWYKKMAYIHWLDSSVITDNIRFYDDTAKFISTQLDLSKS